MKGFLRSAMACAAAIAFLASAPAVAQQAPAAKPAAPATAAPAAAGDDILTTAGKAGNFKTLAKALDAAGLTAALKGKGPFTVFAPTDDAFAKVPKETMDALLDPKNKTWLEQTLKAHVLAGKTLTSKRIAEAKSFNVRMLNGSSVAIATKDGPTFGGAKISKADIAASNGLIHVIDAVYLPKRVRAALATKAAAAKVTAAAGPAASKAKEATIKAYEKSKEAAQKAYEKAKATLEKASSDLEKAKKN
jgi:uncharacterized surface protein with fasciclin (FAS1) repeats